MDLKDEEGFVEGEERCVSSQMKIPWGHSSASVRLDSYDYILLTDDLRWMESPNLLLSLLQPLWRLDKDLST